MPVQCASGIARRSTLFDKGDISCIGPCALIQWIPLVGSVFDGILVRPQHLHVFAKTIRGCGSSRYSINICYSKRCALCSAEEVPAETITRNNKVSRCSRTLRNIIYEYLGLACGINFLPVYLHIFPDIQSWRPSCNRCPCIIPKLQVSIGFQNYSSAGSIRIIIELNNFSFPSRCFIRNSNSKTKNKKITGISGAPIVDEY
jgi:hypothetical protein